MRRYSNVARASSVNNWTRHRSGRCVEMRLQIGPVLLEEEALVFNEQRMRNAEEPPLAPTFARIVEAKVPDRLRDDRIRRDMWSESRPDLFGSEYRRQIFWKKPLSHKEFR